MSATHVVLIEVRDTMHDEWRQFDVIPNLDDACAELATLLVGNHHTPSMRWTLTEGREVVGRSRSTGRELRARIARVESVTS